MKRLTCSDSRSHDFFQRSCCLPNDAEPRRHERVRDRLRLVHDAPVAEDVVRQRAVVAERGRPAEEVLVLPAVEDAQQGGPPVGREAARRAGDGAEDRLRALDHAERDVVAHLLHAAEPVRGLVQGVRVADDGADARIAEVGHETSEGIRLEHRVGIDERTDVGARAPDALGHRGTLAAIRVEADADDGRIAVSRLQHPLPGLVARPVVDDDHVELVARVVAREAGVDRRGDPVLLVERGDDDRHARPVAEVGRRPVQRREQEARADVHGDEQRVAVEERVVHQQRGARVLRQPDPVQQEGAVEDARDLHAPARGAHQQRARGPGRRDRRRTRRPASWPRPRLRLHRLRQARRLRAAVRPLTLEGHGAVRRLERSPVMHGTSAGAKTRANPQVREL